MTNPQAFPLDAGDNKHGFCNEGMTLRDYFAGQALVGVLLNEHDKGTDIPNVKEAASMLSYMLADAMLRERER